MKRNQYLHLIPLTSQEKYCYYHAMEFKLESTDIYVHIFDKWETIKIKQVSLIFKHVKKNLYQTQHN
jgi:hypothetical protein